MLDQQIEVPAGDVAPPAVQEARPQGIAVLGSHPATVAQAPFSDPDWLVYSCSPHNFEHRHLPRWDQWFELHDTVADKTRGYHYLRSLEESARQKQQTHQEPVVWMRDKTAVQWFPGGRLYPEQEIRARFPMPDDPYMQKFFRAFTSSISFMLAKAIADCEDRGIPSIGIWGVMQASATEYVFQRPGIQFFIAHAAARGIKVVAPKESGLFDVAEPKW